VEGETAFAIILASVSLLTGDGQQIFERRTPARSQTAAVTQPTRETAHNLGHSDRQEPACLHGGHPVPKILYVEDNDENTFLRITGAAGGRPRHIRIDTLRSGPGERSNGPDSPVPFPAGDQCGSMSHTTTNGGEHEMKGKVVFVAAMIALLFGLASPASADFTIVYPDGSLGIDIDLGFDQHAAVFWDTNFDIFTFHASAGDPFSISLGGFQSGIAYYLFFLGTDQLGRSVFDVFVKTSLGSGFFFATTIAF
jgi:hypothetical protein